MIIKELDINFRDIVNSHVKELWGGPLMVTKCEMYDTSQLPGLFALDDDGSLSGALLYRIIDDECEIAGIFVLNEGKGIGTGLISTVTAKARELNCKRLWLITTNDNTYAMRFYQKRGFTLKAVHINAMNETRKLKPALPYYGIDGIPLLHEIEFEILLNAS